MKDSDFKRFLMTFWLRLFARITFYVILLLLLKICTSIFLASYKRIELKISNHYPTVNISNVRFTMWYDYKEDSSSPVWRLVHYNLPLILMYWVKLRILVWLTINLVLSDRVMLLLIIFRGPEILFMQVVLICFS